MPSDCPCHQRLVYYLLVYTLVQIDGTTMQYQAFRSFSLFLVVDQVLVFTNGPASNMRKCKIFII